MSAHTSTPQPKRRRLNSVHSSGSNVNNKGDEDHGKFLEGMEMDSFAVAEDEIVVEDIELRSFEAVDKAADVLATSTVTSELSAALVQVAFSWFAPWQDQVTGHPTRDFQANRKRFYKNGGLKRMIELLREENESSVREDAIAALWNYCCSTEDQERVHSLGGTDVVLDIIIGYGRHRQFRCDVKGSLGIIWHLCCLDSVRRRVMERNVLHTLVRLNSYLPDFCTGIFFHISRLSENHVAMANTACIEYLMSNETGEESLDIKTRKMITLASLATHPKNLYRTKTTNFLPFINKFCAEHTPSSLCNEEGFHQKEELQFMTTKAFLDLSACCFEEVQCLALLILAAGTMKKKMYLYKECEHNSEIHDRIILLSNSTNTLVQKLANTAGSHFNLNIRGDGSRNSQGFVAKTMQELLDSGDFADVKIRCADGTLDAHRCILKARCPELLRRVDECESLEHITVVNMKQVLSYIYCGGLDLMKQYNSKRCVEIAEIAEEFMLNHLQEELLEFEGRATKMQCPQVPVPKKRKLYEKGVCGQSLNGFNEIVLTRDVMLSVQSQSCVEFSFDFPSYVEPGLVVEAYFEAGIMNMDDIQVWSNGQALSKDDCRSYEPSVYRFPIMDATSRRHTLVIQNMGEKSRQNAVVLFVGLHFRNWHGVGSVSFLDDMKSMMNDTESEDLTIVCAEGKKLRCHKAVLVSRFTYFHAMLVRSGMKESNCDEIHLPFLSEEMTKLLLRWAYVNHITSRSVHQILELLSVSEMIGADVLANDCKDMLRRGLDHNNVLDTFVTAHVHSLVSAKLLCNHLIAQATMLPRLMDKIVNIFESCPELIPTICNISAVKSSALAGPLAKNERFLELAHNAGITFE